MGQSYRPNGSPIELTERFVLYSGDQGLGYRLVFRNPTDQQQQMPGFTTETGIVEGRQGEMFLEGYGQTEILALSVGSRLDRSGKRPDKAIGCWHGRIDELAVFNHALTSEQIQQLYDTVEPPVGGASTQ